LTEDDIYQFNQGSWSIAYDATKQRKYLRIIGKDVILQKILTPTHTPDLGNETEIIEDGSINTTKQASDMADQLSAIYQNSEVLATAPINYSVPNQDYQNLKIGTLVSLVINNGSNNICNFTGTTKLVIIGMNVKKDESTGDQEIITLTMMRFYT